MTNSVWRPLYYPAEGYPLAVIDPRSLDPAEDLILVDRLSEAANSPSANVAYNPNLRWYWLSDQKPEEPLVFVQYDSHPPEGLFNREPLQPPSCLT